MSQQPTRPLPPLDPDLEIFWNACRRHELVLQRCKNCGQYIYHPRRYCGNCWSDESEWIKATGRGFVYSYTIIRQVRHPFFLDKMPYIVAYVELDEGVQMLSNIVEVEPEMVHIGMPVEVVFENVTDQFSVFLFRPRSSVEGRPAEAVP